MAMKKASGIISIVIVLAMITAEVEVTKAIQCNISSLYVCLPVIKDPSLEPTADCCTNLKAQQPCFCTFLQDPKNKPFFNSPGAKKLSSACGVPSPVCH